MSKTDATEDVREAAYRSNSNILFAGVKGIQMNPLPNLELPVFLILAYIYREHFQWSLLLPMFIYYCFKECICMSVCLHRYFSHKGFSCSRSVQFILYYLGCLASQGPPLWWASKHRRHHAFCDTEQDPHSPVAFNKFYAWIGWAYTQEGPFGVGPDAEYLSDYFDYPELVYFESFNMLPVILHHYLFYVYGGIAWAVYVSMLSGILCQLLTMYFNVAFHSHEPQEGVQCKASDIPTDPLSQIFGEAYHLWHHENPRAFARPGLDLPYYFFIKPLLVLGVFQGKNTLRRNKESAE